MKAPATTEAKPGTAKNEIRVLSKEGVLEAGLEERKLLCLLADGRLLIAEGHDLNPHVLSYRARLEKMNRPYRPVFTGSENIAVRYATGIASTPACRRRPRSCWSMPAMRALPTSISG